MLASSDSEELSAFCNGEEKTGFLSLSFYTSNKADNKVLIGRMAEVGRSL